MSFNGYALVSFTDSGSNITRAVYAKLIDTAEYFKFAHCIVSLTEEDLLLLKNRITEDVVSSNDEYIDDFRGLGLMRECAGGYIFTKRAFGLVKYGISYEGTLKFPEKYPERLPTGMISEKDFNEIQKMLG